LPELNDSTRLCLACGLCCDGSLFSWAKLRPAELDPAAALGMRVFREPPQERGFAQPCPLWQGKCSIHGSSHYPHVCRAYRCGVLKRLQAGEISLAQALLEIEQTRQAIEALRPLLSPGNSFREQLMAALEAIPPNPQALTMARVFETRFGVSDLWPEDASQRRSE